MFVYTLGGAHAYRAAAREIVRRQGEGELAGEVTTVVVAEIASALNRGIGAVLSADRAFEGVEGLERVDPLDERAVADLAALL